LEKINKEDNSKQYKNVKNIEDSLIYEKEKTYKKKDMH